MTQTKCDLISTVISLCKISYIVSDSNRNIDINVKFDTGHLNGFHPDGSFIATDRVLLMSYPKWILSGQLRCRSLKCEH